ncbi:hypothetical protein SK355_02970 [Candidatus Fukatsuia symbiotica]|nr:hypothetical protein [Candidatus Fukatsuia symbiotica]MEA9444294.1 hypothetical protein [Candidatus Fukatsuia symbiotica]
MDLALLTSQRVGDIQRMKWQGTSPSFHEIRSLYPMNFELRQGGN